MGTISVRRRRLKFIPKRKAALALCPEIARLHGARLQIESEPRKGTCVSIIFDKKGETE